MKKKLELGTLKTVNGGTFLKGGCCPPPPPCQSGKKSGKC